MVRAVIASTVGTSIEWYDYFLFGTMAALVFPKLFSPKDSLCPLDFEAEEFLRGPTAALRRFRKRKQCLRQFRFRWFLPRR